MTPVPTPASPRPSGVSPAARNLSEWWRQVDQLLRAARTLGPDAVPVEQQTAKLVESFMGFIGFHAPLVMSCTAVELWLRDELVIRQREAGEDADPIERRVPFLLFRDGIRGLTFDADTSHDDVRTLLGALVHASAQPGTDRDIVTQLWAADLNGMSVEIAPLAECLAPPETEAVAGKSPGAPEPPRRTLEPIASLMVPAAVWACADGPVDVAQAWEALQAQEATGTLAWSQQVEIAGGRLWPERLERLERALSIAEPGPASHEALVAALAGWLVGAMRGADWLGATQAIEGLRRADPDREWSGTQLARALHELDAEAVAERLDESSREDITRFFTLTVRMGRPALELVVRVMARADRPRVRAAATSALAYIGAEDPRALAPYVRDPRWQVARNVVFALGQVGGEEVGRALASSLLHSDARVRRAAVESLGQVPVHRRTPLLVSQLDLADSTMLTSVLAMLLREPAPNVLAALLERVCRLDFEARPEESRIALLGALGELRDDRAVPALRDRLNAGGWFAKRTPERRAAARALAMMASPLALDALREGEKSRSEAVRAACQEALERSGEENAA